MVSRAVEEIVSAWAGKSYPDKAEGVKWLRPPTVPLSEGDTASRLACSSELCGNVKLSRRGVDAGVSNQLELSRRPC